MSTKHRTNRHLYLRTIGLMSLNMCSRLKPCAVDRITLIWHVCAYAKTMDNLCSEREQRLIANRVWRKGSRPLACCFLQLRVMLRFASRKILSARMVASSRPMRTSRRSRADLRSTGILNHSRRLSACADLWQHRTTAATTTILGLACCRCSRCCKVINCVDFRMHIPAQHDAMQF